MKLTRWSVALYMALVFACGGVVGAFAHRLYTVSGVSANVAQRNPEEFRKRYMADMKARLQLTDDQAAKLGAVMDDTRARFRDVREKFEHRRGEQMRRRMPQHLDRFRIFRRQDGKPHVMIDWGA